MGRRVSITATRAPPYCSFDGDWNPDDDEDVTIRIEDVAAGHRRREAALARAKASKPPAKKKAKVMAHGKATGKATAADVTCAIGTKIRKAFDGKPFDGEVISYDAKAKYYKIRYEDGDEEEYQGRRWPAQCSPWRSRRYFAVP